MLFAVINKDSRVDTDNGKEEETLAGIIGYLNTSPANLSTEVGFVITLPAFQRTHVTSNAIGLLLQYALELPAQLEDGSVTGGLGLRRVQWQVNAANATSMRTAERMGFRMEANLRWDRVLPGAPEKGKVGNGRPLGPGRDKESRDGEVRIGRDTVLLSLCWDDWEQGAKVKVNNAMNRR